jgi:hypothetical protein
MPRIFFSTLLLFHIYRHCCFLNQRSFNLCYRVDMELRESLKAKSEEGDAFIAEIEVSYHPSFPPSL